MKNRLRALAMLAALSGHVGATTPVVDHSYEVRNVGKTTILDLEYSYGDEVRKFRQLLPGGADRRTQVMPLPASITFRWTTTEDNQRREVSIPLASLNLGDVRKKKVTFDIDSRQLSLSIDYINPQYFRERNFIGAYTAK